MTEQNKARAPDFKGKLDVGVWVNKDKNGNKYLSVKIADSVNCFKNEPKPKEDL